MTEGVDVVKIKLKIPALVKKAPTVDEPEIGDIETIVEKLAVAESYIQPSLKDQDSTPNEFATDIPTKVWGGLEEQVGTLVEVGPATVGQWGSSGPNVQQVPKGMSFTEKYYSLAKAAEEMKELAKEIGPVIIATPQSPSDDLIIKKTAKDAVHGTGPAYEVPVWGLDLGSKDETTIAYVAETLTGEAAKMMTIEDVAKFHGIPATMLAGATTLKDASLKAAKIKQFAEMTADVGENKLVEQGIKDTLKDLNDIIEAGTIGGADMGIQLDKLKAALNDKQGTSTPSSVTAFSEVKDVEELGAAKPAAPGSLANAKFMYQAVNGTTSVYYTVAVGPQLKCAARWDKGTLSVRYEGQALNGEVRNWLKAAGFKVAENYASIHVSVGDNLGATWKSIAQRTLMSMLGASMYQFKSPLPLFERLVQCSQQKHYGL